MSACRDYINTVTQVKSVLGVSVFKLKRCMKCEVSNKATTKQIKSTKVQTLSANGEHYYISVSYA